MPSVKQLKEQRAEHGEVIQTIAARLETENRDFTPSERSTFDHANSEFKRLHREIEAEEAPYRHLPIPGTEDRVGGSFRRSREEREERREEAADLALHGWCRAQHRMPLTRAQVQACKRSGLNPYARAIDITLPRRPGEEQRSLSGTVGSQGGYTVSKGFVSSLEKAMKAYNGVRQVADVIRTDDGRDMPWPTVNDTASMGRRLGESEQVQQKDPPFGFVNFGAYKYTSDLVLVPVELLEDTSVNMADELSAMLGERIGRIQEQDFTVGVGPGSPQGVVTGSAFGATAGSGSTITGDDVVNLIHSVDPVYRRDPSFRLMFHDLVLAVIRKMKDSTGRYIFEEGQNGAPNKVKGVEYVINQNMPQAIASGVKSMLAGPFKKYKVRDVKKVRVKRLDERYADYDQVGFVAFMRSDGRILNAGTGPIRHLVHP